MIFRKNYILKIVFIIILSVYSFIPLFGKNSFFDKDSLTSQLEKEKSDKKRIEILLTLCNEFASSNPSEIENHASELISLSNTNKDTIGQILGFYHLGYCYYVQSEFLSAQKYLFKSYRLASVSHNDSLKVDALNVIAVIQAQMGDYKKALKYFHQILIISKNNKYHRSELLAMNNIGNCYLNLEDTTKGELFFIKAYQLSKQRNSKPDIYFSAYNLANFYNTLKINSKAEVYIKEVIEMADSLGDIEMLINANYLFTKIYINTNRFNQALKVAIEGAEKAEKYKLRTLQYKFYDKISEIFIQLNNDTEALNWYKKSIELKDEIFNESSQKKIFEIQAKYETELKDEELKLKDEKISHQTFLNQLYVSVLFIIIVLFSAIAFLYIKRSQQYSILAKINNELTRNENTLRLVINDLNKKREEFITYSQEKSLPNSSFLEFNENFVKEKYGSSALSDDKKMSLLKEVLYLLDEKKVYKQKDLTIEKLSIMLNINSKYLSQVINETTDQNFSLFINEFRIKEARNLLIDKAFEHYTIEAIGELVGFQSKSAFNNAFKRTTGITPSFYQKKTIMG